jgi:hypothetical protein
MNVPAGHFSALFERDLLSIFNSVMTMMGLIHLVSRKLP